MKPFVLFACFFLSFAPTNAQVIIPTSTLPEVGETQTYTTFNLIDDTVSYRMSGAHQLWSYDSLNTIGSVDEEFGDIQGTALADSFPSANMVVSLTGFQSAAIRGDSSIEVIGLAINSFSAIGVDGKASFSEPFTFRKTPFSYGDSIGDSFSFLFQFSSELIPALDTIELPIPGATLDSMRLTFNFTKTEVADGWGNLSLYNELYDVLHVKVENLVNSKIELGVSAFGNLIWIDASPFFGDINFGQSSTSYKFLIPDSKQTLLEFNEVRGVDGELNTTGRISNEVISGSDRINSSKSSITISPNPCNNVFALSNDLSNNEYVDILILTTNGQLVREIRNAKFNDNISVDQLASGCYTLLAINNEEVHSQRLMIIK